jgi:serine/threonine protein kinase/tetratricopeptide (TPR) repeat protein
MTSNRGDPRDARAPSGDIGTAAKAMIGRHVAHYRILQKLGEGGMGVVYKAEDTRLKRVVALKFLPAAVGAEPVRRERFTREAMAASSLDHPNICTIHAIDQTDDGALFIVMAFCDGETVADIVGRGPLPVDRALDVVGQVAEGLAKAHAGGIVHRDIKPGNLMFTRDGFVKIVDFGLAKAAADENLLTQTGVVIGTPAYMSPEQLQDQPVDARTDLWALGVVCYELLSGQRPFRGATTAAVVSAIQQATPAPIADLPRDVAANVQGLLDHLLARDPEDRFPDAGSLLAALRAIRGHLPASGVLRSLTTAGAARRLPSIAVLPFDNRSSDPENEFFSDGLTEELINALAQVKDLRVISRRSAFEFKGKARDIQQVGRQLRVQNVLEGSVRRAGSRVRITTELTSIADDRIVWAQSYDRSDQDIFAVQDEIAAAIVAALKVKLTESAEPPHARGTPNLKAYYLYLQGRFHWNKQTAEGFGKALECYQQALALDPDYAPAHCGLADYYGALGSWSLMPPGEVWPQARDAANRAHALEPRLAPAHFSLGTLAMFYEWNWTEAERSFLRAIEIQPGYLDAHSSYALLLCITGRMAESLSLIRRARELDPLSVPAATYEGALLAYAGQYDAAVEVCRKALEIAPGFVEAYYVLAIAHQLQGRMDDALAEFTQALAYAGNNPLVLGCLGTLHALCGHGDKARELLSTLAEQAKTSYVAPITRAMIHGGLGELDEAFVWLEKSAEARDSFLVYLRLAPMFSPLRADPRYASLVRRMGLERVTPAGSDATTHV